MFPTVLKPLELDSRGQRLRQAFLRRFAGEPTGEVRAPGRVNLIGEHIDYCDLPVLPIAVQRDIRIALRPREDRRVIAVNTDPSHAPLEFEIGPTIERAPLGDWSNYLRAAAQALSARHGSLRGFDAAIDGDIPQAAGLSSSSALLVATALALLQIAAIDFDPLELAGLCARAEHYVGTNSGGMDQAASLLARAGCALRVDFAPLRVRAIDWPASWTVLVADSLQVADKAGRLRDAYNERRADAEEAMRRVRGAEGDAALADRDWLIRQDEGEVLERAARCLDARLLRRFRHVLTEARRVESAIAAIQREDLPGFGELINGSHRSLRDDCEVSTPTLDELCALARTHGAAGARLCGAGMGGSMLAVCRQDRAEALMQELAERFYAGRVAPNRLGRHLWFARPSNGACAPRA